LVFVGVVFPIIGAVEASNHTMNKITKCLLFVVMSGLPFHARSAGFDCAKATTPVEKMICTDAQLSKLDDSLKVAYKKALSNASIPAEVKAEQQYWLQEVRDACHDVACLKQVYTLRLPLLDGGGLSGEYQRDSEPNNASITVRPVEYQQFEIKGDAVWVGNAETGNVNIGELDGLSELEGNKLHYSSGSDAFACKLTITFAGKRLTVSDDNSYCGGHNVTFNGEYHKVGKKTR
jgi:uncharacterized protein